MSLDLKKLENNIEKSFEKSNHIDLTPILLVTFIVLKALGYLTWSWWLVILVPIGISLGFYTLMTILLIILCLIVVILSKND